jgi:hypothetical protein
MKILITGGVGFIVHGGGFGIKKQFLIRRMR